LSTFVWLSGLRWAVEQCFEEGKTELGMAHYEVRTYAGGCGSFGTRGS
jgi:SRSO17 transposase